MELLTATVKLFFKRPPEVQKMLGRLLKDAIAETSQIDVRDRALLYYRLLKYDIHEVRPDHQEFVFLASARFACRRMHIASCCTVHPLAIFSSRDHQKSKRCLVVCWKPQLHSHLKLIHKIVPLLCWLSDLHLERVFARFIVCCKEWEYNS